MHRIGRTGRMGNLGVATSFFNDKNRSICPDLVELLVETKQEVPGFMEDIMLSERSHGGRRNNRGRYTATSRDYRASGGNQNRNQNRNGNGGGRGMGNSGYGGNRGMCRSCILSPSFSISLSLTFSISKFANFVYTFAITGYNNYNGSASYGGNYGGGGQNHSNAGDPDWWADN